MRLVRQTGLFQHDRDLHPIRRGQGIELQPVGMIGRPTLCDGEGGEIGHTLPYDFGFGGRYIGEPTKSHALSTAAALVLRPRQPMKLNIVGAKNPKAIRAAPIAPRAPLSHTSAVIPVMMAADASTIAIWVRPLPSS
jgi:hypothetical protein